MSVIMETPEKIPPLQSSERNWSAVITSRNLSLVVVGAVLLSAIFKADSKDVPKIIELVFSSHAWATTGWILAVIILIVCVIFFRVIMALHDKEMSRLTKERDELQSILLTRQG